MTGDLEIRDAALGDLPAILEIYNDVIATTTAVYSDDPVTLADREKWYADRVAQGFPVLVAIRDGECVGFASFGDFRAWPCYRRTAEHSVHVRADARGGGIGRRLVEALIGRAEALQKHVLIAGIDAQNEASIALHRKLGFIQVAHFYEVGWKFGRWLDLVFMQRILD